MPETFIDPDPQETRDWLDSLNGVIEAEGRDKAKYLLRELNNSVRAGVSNRLIRQYRPMRIPFRRIRPKPFPATA